MEEGQRPIYLDMQATTPVDPRVLDAMIPYYVGVYGNPHSRTHAYGWESEKAVEEAREHIASLIGADPKEIIFTSGATESNNMSIKGVARFFGRSGKKRHIITTQTMVRYIPGLTTTGVTPVARPADPLTDLTRLLNRLQQTILRADAEREARLRASEYEREKAQAV